MTRYFAVDASRLYHVFKFASLSSGADFMRSNPARPMSAMGGGFWFDLGLHHWDFKDSGGLTLPIPARGLTLGEVSATAAGYFTEHP